MKSLIDLEITECTSGEKTGLFKLAVESAKKIVGSSVQEDKGE